MGDTNLALIERVGELMVALQKKNSRMATAINRGVIGMLEYALPLAQADEAALAGMGLPKKAAPYVRRVLGGESVEDVLAAVPKQDRVVHTKYRRVSKSATNWDGSADNAARTYEGRF